VQVNEAADQSTEELKTLLTAERLRRDRQPWLNEFVRKLNAEYEAQ